MENDLLLRRGFRNIGPVKVEGKIRNGPVLKRAALGDLHNKPALLPSNVDLKNKQSQILKKQIIPHPANPFPALTTKSQSSNNVLQKPTARIRQKENLPLEVPVNQKINEDEDEVMEVDEMEKMQVEELSIAFSSQMLNIKDIDNEDSKNPQLVSEYVKDIYKYLWKLEDAYRVSPNYLESQKITSRMRCILIDWLVQVHLRFTFLQETLYLTVSILDRYLQKNTSVTKDKLQLVGVTSMFIASKYEEMYIPEIGDFAYITDKTFSKKDIRLMEVHILQTLGFYISFPLPLHFLRRNSKAGKVDGVHHTLAKYLMELTLQEYSFSHIKASLLAAAALYLSVQVIGNGTKWDEVMVFYSNYSEDQVLPIVYKLSAYVIKSCSVKQQAVRNKYKSSKVMKISEIPELKPTSRLLKSFAVKAISC